MEGVLPNGKAFRYVHHYLSEQVFGCGGVGCVLGGGGGENNAHVCLTNGEVCGHGWLYPTADLHLQETGEKLLDINRQVKGQVDTG